MTYDTLKPISPRAWGARVDYDRVNWTPWKPDKYVLHWGGDGAYPAGIAPYGEAREMAQLRAWENYHINDKGWQGIAYNYAIGQTGNLYRLRGENRSGATSGDADDDGIPENHEAVAVLFIVGAKTDTPSPVAINTFRHMYTQRPLPGGVIGHRDATKTSCPGPFLYSFVESGNWGLAPQPPEVTTVQYRNFSNVPASKGVVDRHYAEAIDRGIERGVFPLSQNYDASRPISEGRMAIFFDRLYNAVMRDTARIK